MIILLELTVLILLAIVVIRGLRVWHKHRVIVSTFDGGDLWTAVFVKVPDAKVDRTDAWVARNFILISASTVLAMADFCLRLNWALQNKWAVSGDGWAYAWLIFHVGIGAYFLKAQHFADAALLTMEDWDGMGDDK